MKQGTSPVARPSFVPDVVQSVFAKSLNTSQSWDATLAQANLHLGTEPTCTVVRVPEDTTSSTQSTVWHIADIDPVTKTVTIVNAIETNPAVTEALQPQLND
eukprot:TRINITY_DN10562_c0_g1_i2.p2 TRINITY_DN10562_c0_g1~~TRINITY_DN10562_c0_g1_i2.p2  ORF type:complete len:102 (-),score=17.43 TRINITY_DN10562_c0_g1_i2:62-367(-)